MVTALSTSEMWCFRGRSAAVRAQTSKKPRRRGRVGLILPEPPDELKDNPTFKSGEADQGRSGVRVVEEEAQEIEEGPSDSMQM